MEKIDFTVIISAKNANPNGDPNNGNRPRQDMNEYGEIEDVCIKRKIRNWLQHNNNVLCQSEDNKTDDYKSIRSRIEGVLGKDVFNNEDVKKLACEHWLDVRTFGALLAFGSVSIGIRGAVSIGLGESISPVDISENKITKSYNAEDSKKKGSDTMGDKYRVKHGLYRINGSVNPHFASKNEFDEEDWNEILIAIKNMFENDASAARPAGSMNVEKIYVWKQKSVKYSSKRVFDSLKINPLVEIPTDVADYEFILDDNNIKPDIYDE